MKIELSCTFSAAELKTAVRGPLPADSPVALTVTREIDDERGDWLDLEASVRVLIPSLSDLLVVRPCTMQNEPNGSTIFYFDSDAITEACELVIRNMLGILRRNLEASGSLQVGILDPNQARVDSVTGLVDTAEENLVATLTLPSKYTAALP